MFIHLHTNMGIYENEKAPKLFKPAPLLKKNTEDLLEIIAILQPFGLTHNWDPSPQILEGGNTDRCWGMSTKVRKSRCVFTGLWSFGVSCTFLALHYKNVVEALERGVDEGYQNAAWIRI